ncbi:MAG: hypothetical protein OEN01_12580 [Candidatus Krumholzibacteria bacterium]|nr:hypothetical protein [Candidatus Krumholzibacteria bacterium]
MSKHHRRSPRENDRDQHDRKRFDRKARRGRRSKVATSRAIPPPLAADEFELLLLDDEFDDAFGFEAEDGNVLDSDAFSELGFNDVEH